MGAEGARRERMQRILVGLLAASLSLLGLPLRAENRTAPKGPDEDGTKPALVRIAGEGLLNSHAFGFLTELSDDIGGRVTGTPADRQAEEWGVAKMKSLGLENVHTEQYTIWRGWTRGTAEGEILAPVHHRLQIDAMGWTGSTPAGGAEGDVVRVNMFDIENELKNVSRLKGKIALVTAKGQPPQNEMNLFALFGDFLKAAGTARVLAVISIRNRVLSSAGISVRGIWPREQQTTPRESRPPSVPRKPSCVPGSARGARSVSFCLRARSKDSMARSRMSKSTKRKWPIILAI